jgi:hypothetical protein
VPKPEVTELIRSPVRAGGKSRHLSQSGTPHFTDGSRFVTVKYIGTLGYRGNPAAASSPSKGANVECARKWLRPRSPNI